MGCEKTSPRNMLMLAVVLGLAIGTEAFFDLKGEMEKNDILCYEDGDLDKVLGCVNLDLIISVIGASDNCSSAAIQAKCSLLQEFIACFNEKQMTEKCITSATKAIDLLGGTEYCDYTAERVIDECFGGSLPVVYPVWAEWGPFQECSVTCGDEGVHQRERTCVNKDMPSEPRSGCAGNSVETDQCSMEQVCSAATPGATLPLGMLWSSLIFLGLLPMMLNSIL